GSPTATRASPLPRVRSSLSVRTRPWLRYTSNVESLRLRLSTNAPRESGPVAGRGFSGKGARGKGQVNKGAGNGAAARGDGGGNGAGVGAGNWAGAWPIEQIPNRSKAPGTHRERRVG